MSHSSFLDPVQPKNASRVLKYLCDASGLQISSLKEPPSPTTGGIENRNYYISATGDGISYDFILRCPPEETPEWRKGDGLYDLYREYRILQELPSLSIGIITSKVYGYDQVDTFGIPCFLMDRIPGKALTYHFNPAYDEFLIREFANIIAKVSTISYESNLWLANNLPRWTLDRVIEWLDKKSRRFHSDPLVQYALSWMREHRPPSQKLAMCHGDLNPGNFLVRDNHVIAAVDWEFACLTDDPLDYLLCVGWLQDREELRQLFCQAQGRDVEELKWFEVRGWFGLTYVNRSESLFQTHRQKLSQVVGFKCR